MNNPINNQVFDTRDLIEYREHLESEILESYIEWAESHNEHCDEGQEIGIPTSFDDIEFLNEEVFTNTCHTEIEEYDAIKEFCDELEACAPDYQYGEAVIHEDYFTEYSTDLVKDCGYIPNELPAFIENNIDWDGVAEELKVDYITVDYDGSTYYIR